MSWSAKTFWNNHSWPSSESIGNRGGIVPTKSGVMKDPAEVKHESTVWLFRDALTFTDVLIGIDLVRHKMWPSEPITFWLSSKSIENRTESGGTYQRNQAFRLTTACGFFEMPWPSQMSIRTHRVILSIDVIWCLIGTDFVRGKMCLSNL